MYEAWNLANRVLSVRLLTADGAPLCDMASLKSRIGQFPVDAKHRRICAGGTNQRHELLQRPLSDEWQGRKVAFIVPRTLKSKLVCESS